MNEKRGPKKLVPSHKAEDKLGLVLRCLGFGDCRDVLWGCSCEVQGKRVADSGAPLCHGQTVFDPPFSLGPQCGTAWSSS